jgi:L-lactate utilization protein LutB
MNINKRLYRILSEYFKNNIKLSFIAFRNAIIVNKEDRVYQFDENFKENYCSVEYCRDDKELKTLIEESIIEELCGKNVVDFKSGIIYYALFNTPLSTSLFFTAARSQIYVDTAQPTNMSDECIVNPLMSETLNHL